MCDQSCNARNQNRRLPRLIVVEELEGSRPCRKGAQNLATNRQNEIKELYDRALFGIIYNPAVFLPRARMLCRVFVPYIAKLMLDSQPDHSDVLVELYGNELPKERKSDYQALPDKETKVSYLLQNDIITFVEEIRTKGLGLAGKSNEGTLTFIEEYFYKLPASVIFGIIDTTSEP